MSSSVRCYQIGVSLTGLAGMYVVYTLQKRIKTNKTIDRVIQSRGENQST